MPIEIKEIVIKANTNPPAKSASTTFDRKLPVDPAVANANLETALRRVEALAARVCQLERAISVGDDGSVTLAARGPLCIVSDQSVVISAPQKVALQCSGNSVSAEATKVTIASPGRLDLVASTIGLMAGMVSVDAGMTQTSGTFKCDTIIANSVVGASYTPGAGNVM